MPKLFSANNNCVIKTATNIFNKYNHLLKFKNNESILEVGTGDGRTTVECLLPKIPEDISEFVASDKSKIMLDYARQRERLFKMKFIELDIETSKVPTILKHRFDHIFSLWTFHYVKNTR